VIRARGLVVGALACASAGCTVGKGEGAVRSERLYIKDCWNGPLDLQPDFFAANPDSQSLLMRVQRGDNIEDVSDGLSIVIPDLQDVRQHVGEDIPVGLPPGVSPPGVPIVLSPNPPKVSLTLYLHGTCHLVSGTVYSVTGSGTIHFNSLFSGDPNESSSAARLTDATFTADFADPRQLVTADASERAQFTSTVTGNFRFFFQRGQPAQPFQ
jgi:hypothetical protein